MKKSTAEKIDRKAHGGTRTPAVEVHGGYEREDRTYLRYVGLDVHKKTIAVSVAYAGRALPEYRGEIPNTPKAVERLLRRMSEDGEVMSFCYEAGPCGYGLYRQIVASGHDCSVVAPSLIPVKAGDRVKTDRRDAQMLARLHRAGELTSVWVPDEEQEAIRDLVRAREDMKGARQQVRRQLNGYLLRHGKVYDQTRHWTQAHGRWLEQVKFHHSVQQIVFQEYVESEKAATQRLQGLTREMERALENWTLAPVIEALMALRGVDLLNAMTVVAELGDISRFDNPRQLMAYLGLVPSEHSSGGTRRRGGITKTGNGHARRALVEAAWSYRFPARKTRHLQRRAEKAPQRAQAIAWAAQKRLCGRYQHLVAKGKLTVQACTAVARELAGFIWAIACEVAGKGNLAASRV
jgi:transposase